MENICKKGQSCYRFYGILMNIAAILQLTSFAIGIFYSFFYNFIAVIILDGGFRFSNIGYYVRNAINIETLIYSILCLGIFFLIRYYGKQYLRANGEKEIKEKDDVLAKSNLSNLYHSLELAINHKDYDVALNYLTTILKYNIKRSNTKVQ